MLALQSHGEQHLGTSQDSGEGSSDTAGILNTVNTMTSRVKLNFKVLGVQVGPRLFFVDVFIAWLHGLKFATSQTAKYQL
jgi:hypothetical protein